MDDMARRVGLIRDLSSRLRHFLAGLSREEWTRPSACELWEVREVVAHLTGGAERQIQSMVRGRKGDAAPPPGFAPLDVAALSASNAQRDIAMRERLGMPCWTPSSPSTTGSANCWPSLALWTGKRSAGTPEEAP